MSLDQRKREEKRRGKKRRKVSERERERERRRERERTRERERERFICLYYCFYFHKFVLVPLSSNVLSCVHFLVFSHYFISHLNSFVLNIHLPIL